jgi:hypothetical protein
MFETPISDDQRGFIGRLAEEREVPTELLPVVEAVLESGEVIGRQSASSLIQRLIESPRRSGGWQRLSTDEMLADLAEHRSAAKQRARQDTPLNA